MPECNYSRVFASGKLIKQAIQTAFFIGPLKNWKFQKIICCGNVKSVEVWKSLRQSRIDSRNVWNISITSSCTSSCVNSVDYKVIVSCSGVRQPNRLNINKQRTLTFFKTSGKRAVMNLRWNFSLNMENMKILHKKNGSFKGFPGFFNDDTPLFY